MTIDNDTVVFESSGKGTVIAEQELARLYLLSAYVKIPVVLTMLIEESRIKSG